MQFLTIWISYFMGPACARLILKPSEAVLFIAVCGTNSGYRAIWLVSIMPRDKISPSDECGKRTKFWGLTQSTFVFQLCQLLMVISRILLLPKAPLPLGVQVMSSHTYP